MPGFFLHCHQIIYTERYKSYFYSVMVHLQLIHVPQEARDSKNSRPKAQA